MDAVGARVLPFAPRAQKISCAVEHHDRMVPAVEDIDVIFAVDADRTDLLERPSVGELRPILDDAVLEIAGANNDRHPGPPPMCRGQVNEATGVKQSSRPGRSTSKGPFIPPIETWPC